MQQNSKNIKHSINPFYDAFLEKNKSYVCPIEKIIDQTPSPYFNQKNNDSNRTLF